jgi:hypothetical protein
MLLVIIEFENAVLLENIWLCTKAEAYINVYP